MREIRGRISECSNAGGGEEEEGESGRGCYGGAGGEEGGEEVSGVRSSDAHSGIVGGDGGEKRRGRVRRIKFNSGGLCRRGKSRYVDVRRNRSHRQGTKVAQLLCSVLLFQMKERGEKTYQIDIIAKRSKGLCLDYYLRYQDEMVDWVSARGFQLKR